MAERIRSTELSEAQLRGLAPLYTYLLGVGRIKGDQIQQLPLLSYPAPTPEDVFVSSQHLQITEVPHKIENIPNPFFPYTTTGSDIPLIREKGISVSARVVDIEKIPRICGYAVAHIEVGAASISGSTNVFQENQSLHLLQRSVQKEIQISLINTHEAELNTRTNVEETRHVTEHTQIALERNQELQRSLATITAENEQLHLQIDKVDQKLGHTYKTLSKADVKKVESEAFAVLSGSLKLSADALFQLVLRSQVAGLNRSVVSNLFNEYRIVKDPPIVVPIIADLTLIQRLGLENLMVANARRMLALAMENGREAKIFDDQQNRAKEFVYKASKKIFSDPRALIIQAAALANWL